MPPHTVIVGQGADEVTLLSISPAATETSGGDDLASDPDNVTGAVDILTASEATSCARSFST